MRWKREIAQPEIEPPKMAVDLADAATLYDRHAVDSTILCSQRDIVTLAENDSRSMDHWSNKRLRLAERARNMADERFAELVQDGYKPPEYETHDYDRHDYHLRKFPLIADVWKQRYLLPRVEEVGEDAYDQWAVACVRFGGAAIQLSGYQPRETLYRALHPVELVPLVGASAVRLVVPPGIEVTESEGFSRNEIYRWDDLTHQEITAPPSTQQLLEAEGFLGAHSLGDIEAALRSEI